MLSRNGWDKTTSAPLSSSNPCDNPNLIPAGCIQLSQVFRLLCDQLAEFRVIANFVERRIPLGQGFPTGVL